MKLTLILLISFLWTSCATKVAGNNSTEPPEMINFLSQPFSKIKEQYPDLKKDNEDAIAIGGVSYTKWTLTLAGRNTMQVLSDSNSNSVVEIVRFPINSHTADQKKYPNFYKPKCKSGSSVIKFNTLSKEIALEKNDKVIFQGVSTIIQDRISEDQIRKCLNRWGH